MGCLQSKDDSEQDADEKSRHIDRQIKRDAEASARHVRLLLLGAGGSGKSTIAKQLKILHKEPFSVEDRKLYKEVVYSNIVSCMVAMVRAMESLGIDYENPERAADADKIRALNKPALQCVDLSGSDIGEVIKRLWQDGGIQDCYERSREYQLSDSAKYYLDDLDRLCQPGYIPSEQDVLRTRVNTTGIYETTFEYKNLKFTLIDVGGQRAERKKWIHCFQDVTAIIFCVAMSAYDQVLEEDLQTNRMRESLKLFDSICNNPFFMNTAMILFLNKKDIFEQKIGKSDLKLCFDDYTGQNDYDKASIFIRQKFEGVNMQDKDKREIYTHFTCATDTENVRFVFDVVSDVIVSNIVDVIFGANK